MKEVIKKISPILYEPALRNKGFRKNAPPHEPKIEYPPNVYAARSLGQMSWLKLTQHKDLGMLAINIDAQKVCISWIPPKL